MFKKTIAIFASIFLVWKVILPFFSNKQIVRETRDTDLNEATNSSLSQEVSAEFPAIVPSTAPAIEATDNALEKTTVNINAANVAELQEIPGVGEDLAGKILEYREREGAFETKASLLSIPGIGEKKLAQMLEAIEV